MSDDRNSGGGCGCGCLIIVLLMAFGFYMVCQAIDRLNQRLDRIEQKP